MLKVLIVDTDLAYLKRAEQALSWHDISVQIETSAQAALKIIWQQAPQVVISAIDLDMINGWTFCRLVRSSTRYSQLPFILLANEADSNGAIKAFQLDADDYLPKSISFNELAARIHKRARKTATGLTPTIQSNLLTGRIGKFNLSDILQFLALQGDAWSVTVTNGNSVGQILLARSIVLQAVSGFFDGLAAFHDLLSWTEGTFLIEPLTETVKYGGIGIPLENLLLEIATSEDNLTQELAALDEYSYPGSDACAA